MPDREDRRCRSAAAFTRRPRCTVGVVGLFGLLVGVAPGALAAQGGDGYMLKEPRVSLKFEAGYGFQRAQGDVFDYSVDRFTLGRRDFDSPYLGGEIGIRLDEQWDIALGVGHQSSSAQSESRPYIGTDGLPIEQVTELRLLPVVASAKYYLLPRGRKIGRFAWIPETIVPFVGAGLGIMSYRFEQEGEFVDDESLDIYFDRLLSEGNAFLARASAGVDLSVGRQLVLTGEARYGYSRAPMDFDFSGFDDIDLDGFQLVGGISVRF